mmetsp:Transcript_42825/g.96720  ORF Transcript_42825/g.96720 Transcript_42825/m.96720 type:complete len:188 (-) Transcript_42825:141-704(-)
MGANCSSRRQLFPVTLHIYDIWKSGKVQAANKVLKAFGTGAFHCGVEVHGREWSFKCTPTGTGIFSCVPMMCEEHTFCESMSVGSTPLTKSEVLDLVGKLQGEWPGSSYDSLKHNCCHFSESFCRCLGADSIPGWTMSLAKGLAVVFEAWDYVESKVQRVASSCGACPASHARETYETTVHVEQQKL